MEYRYIEVIYKEVKCATEIAYSKETLAPKPSRVVLIFSASSLATFSFKTFGAASTNFLESTSDKPSKPLTSLMTLALVLASKLSNLTLKMVFSAAAGAASSAEASASAGAAGAAAAPPTGKAISGISSCDFKALIKDEVSTRVSVEIESTMDWIFGSTAAWTGAASVELNLTTIGLEHLFAETDENRSADLTVVVLKEAYMVCCCVCAVLGLTRQPAGTSIALALILNGV